MKIPLLYQRTEYDCGPTSLLYAISFLMERLSSGYFASLHEVIQISEKLRKIRLSTLFKFAIRNDQFAIRYAAKKFSKMGDYVCQI